MISIYITVILLWSVTHIIWGISTRYSRPENCTRGFIWTQSQLPITKYIFCFPSIFLYNKEELHYFFCSPNTIKCSTSL